MSGKSYTFVSVYEYKRYKPETRNNQELKNGTNGSPLSVWFGKDGTYAGFNFCDSYGVWSCGTGDYVEIEEERYGQITIYKKTGEQKDCYCQLTIEE